MKIVAKIIKAVVVIAMAGIVLLAVEDVARISFEDVAEKRRENDDVVLIYNESTLIDFKVKGDTANVMCSLTIENRGQTEARFYIIGDFDKIDVGRLLTHEYLIAKSAENGSELFVLPAGSKMEFEEVVFSDKYAGTKQKWDKNMPIIIIVPA